MSGPASAEEFRRIQAEHRRCVWLDGGGAWPWASSRSILAWLDDDDVSLTYSARRREVTRHAGGRSAVVGDDPFAAVEQELTAGHPSDRWFGYFGYAARPDLPAHPDPDLPDAVWMRPSHIRALDPVDGGFEARELAPQPPVGEVRGAPETGREATTTYANAFAQVQEHLHAGNSYEVNLTHRLRVPGDPDPAAVYLRLRQLNAAPYSGFLQHDVEGARAWLLSSSPERYALITADRVLETRPIKGTTARDTSSAADEEARRRLATAPKFRAENLMIVDLLRNDLATVCEVGSVETPQLMQVESYASVHQLVSTIRGRLRDDVSTVAALEALFPAGSMTGAPKLRTMEIIEEVEATPRGAYSGAFGWIAGDGRADLGVIIRSLMTADPAGGYLLGTGGGITVDSEVGEEWDETQWKAARLLHAVRPA